MPIHHFTLIVDGPDLQDDALIDRLFEAGCDDAAIGKIDGIQYVDFDREAVSVDEAVLSAVTDVERVEGVSVVRVADAGLVSMTDIASRIGRTRESVRLLITGARGPGGFPAPVTDPRSRYRLWRWSDVTLWLTMQLGEAGFPDDRFLTALNASLELRRHRSELDPPAGTGSVRLLICRDWRNIRALRDQRPSDLASSAPAPSARDHCYEGGV